MPYANRVLHPTHTQSGEVSLDPETGAGRQRGGQPVGRRGWQAPGPAEESAALMKGPFFPGDYKNIHDS